MKPNVGGVDRALRIIAGIALLSVTFILDSDARWLGLLGAVPLFTGLLRWCPVYPLLGLRSCPVCSQS